MMDRSAIGQHSEYWPAKKISHPCPEKKKNMRSKSKQSNLARSQIPDQFTCQVRNFKDSDSDQMTCHMPNLSLKSHQKCEITSIKTDTWIRHISDICSFLPFPPLPSPPPSPPLFCEISRDPDPRVKRVCGGNYP